LHVLREPLEMRFEVRPKLLLVCATSPVTSISDSGPMTPTLAAGVRRLQLRALDDSEDGTPMLTGEVRNQIDRIWDAFWSGGIANPLEVIEQITYLLFLRRLDDLQVLEENKAVRLKKPGRARRSGWGLLMRGRPRRPRDARRRRWHDRVAAPSRRGRSPTDRVRYPSRVDQHVEMAAGDNVE